MPQSIDLNSDLGESFGQYRLGHDSEIMAYISSANAACGFHAADPAVMRETVALARQAKVAVGAHVGYPDLVGFGRRHMALTPTEIENDLIYQVGALEAFCRAEGVTLRHVKAHGALYNDSARDEAVARALVSGIKALKMDLLLFLPAQSPALDLARQAGIRTVSEAFADRLYDDAGNLVSRSVPGSTFSDPEQAAAQALEIARNRRVKTRSGKTIEIQADSICVHGDSPQALEIARTVHGRLREADIAIRAPGA